MTYRWVPRVGDRAMIKAFPPHVPYECGPVTVVSPVQEDGTVTIELDFGGRWGDGSAVDDASGLMWTEDICSLRPL